MNNDLAISTSIPERLIVRDISESEFKSSAVISSSISRRREAGEIAGSPDEGSDVVATVEQSVT